VLYAYIAFESITQFQFQTIGKIGKGERGNLEMRAHLVANVLDLPPVF
jgi:hypothetical protein